jgi:nucleoside phosphorylase
MDVQSSVTTVLLWFLSSPDFLHQQATAWLAYRSIPYPVMPFDSPPSFGYADVRVFTQPVARWLQNSRVLAVLAICCVCISPRCDSSKAQYHKPQLACVLSASSLESAWTALVHSLSSSHISFTFPSRYYCLVTIMNELQSLERGELYTVGWVAALPIELAAALAMLDERHGKPDDFEKPSSDDNSYRWGRIGDHNVVIASLPVGVYGTISAATTAKDMTSSFPNIKVGLMVGIGAGIARPNQRRDIRLGDVVVSLPRGQSGGVIQYDLGKSRVSEDQGHTAHTFERVGSLNSPPTALLKALTLLQAEAEMEGSKVSSFLEDILKRYPRMAKNEPDKPGYVYQGQDNDRLFEASYIHASGMGCDDCDSTRTIPRVTRPDPDVPEVHYGVIASGNKLVKDAVERDLILKESGEDCICLEMEAAGLMNSFPCLVIRGICDYADSHKNDNWQKYAAATAAAYAKELLGFVDNQDLARSNKAIDILKNS